MRYLIWSKSQKQKVEALLPGAGWSGERELLFKGYRISVFQNKKF